MNVRWEAVFIGTNEHGDRTYVDVEIENTRNPGTWETVEHQEVIDPLCVSVVARTTRLNGRRWMFDRSCPGGDLIHEVTTPAKGWTLEELATLAGIADAWHLNAMQAGCAHQEVVWETGPYGQRQPSLNGTKPCEASGYRYGTKWLTRVLPDDVRTALTDLMEAHA